MANEKKDLTNGIDLGELGMIRNILMGQQISEWEVKYAEINDNLSEQASLFEDKINMLDQASAKDLSIMQQEISARLDKLESKMEKRLENLESKMIDSNQKDRQKIGKLLSDIGKKLLES